MPGRDTGIEYPVFKAVQFGLAKSDITCVAFCNKHHLILRETSLHTPAPSMSSLPNSANACHDSIGSRLRPVSVRRLPIRVGTCDSRRAEGGASVAQGRQGMRGAGISGHAWCSSASTSGSFSHHQIRPPAPDESVSIPINTKLSLIVGFIFISRFIWG